MVHCAALPILITVAPMLSLHWLSETSVHWTLFALALPLSLLGLWHGFRRHASWLVPALGAFGLLLMGYDLLPAHDDHGHQTTLVGVVLVALAHAVNIRGLRRHQRECCAAAS